MLINFVLFVQIFRERERDRREERSPIRRSSPRRTAKPIARYMVHVPKINLVTYVSALLIFRPVFSI